MGSKPIGISASRGAAVLGLSPYRTPVDVWAAIQEDRFPAVLDDAGRVVRPGFCAAHGIVPPEPVDNAAVRWGTAFESSVIMLAEQATGKQITAREAFCEAFVPDEKGIERGESTIFCSRVPATCHLDGVYGGEIRGGTIHEGKTTSAFAFRENWGEPGSDRIPRQYAVQVQHQMMCSGAARAIVSVLVFPTRPEEWKNAGIDVTLANGHYVLTRKRDDGDPLVFGACDDWARTLAQMGFFHQYEVEADRELQTKMLTAYREFWTRYVLTETQPPAETWNDIKRLVPEPRGTVVATEEQERYATEYAQINAEIAQAEKQQEKLRVLLLGAIDRGAEHQIDNDSVEALILRSRDGRKIASYAKSKSGRKTFRCGG
jgi:predicted phage-related endonuclease